MSWRGGFGGSWGGWGMRYRWGDLISLEYGKPVKDKASLNGPVPVFGTNGKIGTSYLAPLCPNASFILGRKGAYRGVHYSNIPFSVIDTAFYAKNIAPDKLSLKWAYYKFLTYDINNMDSGSAIPSTDRYTIYSIEVELPTLEEQLRTVHLLEALDNKIEVNQRINENLLQQAIALYECLLGKSDWPTATILDVAKKVAMGPFGSNIKVSTFVPEGVPIISGNHLRGYFLEESEFNYITEEHAERLKNSIVFPHDLIFTHAGNIGQVAIIPDGCKYDCYVLSQRQFYLRCDETKVVPEFLLMFFHSASGQHELLSYANQTGVPSIAQPASNLKKIPFKCPPMQEQLMWQEQVHPLLGRYLNNRLENDKLSTLRDTLLPRLMSGELDVFGLDL